jgi:hypothetical protein
VQAFLTRGRAILTEVVPLLLRNNQQASFIDILMALKDAGRVIQSEAADSCT